MRNILQPNRAQRTLIAGIVLCSITAAGVALRANAGGPRPEPTGKVTPWAAIKIALTKVPGTPLNANFEFDEGKWVYGVMIVSGKSIKEVEIDPNTGKIGGVETVTPDDEAQEIKAELTKAVSGKSNPVGKEEKEEDDEKATKKP
jgi:hypothetical protein